MPGEDGGVWTSCSPEEQSCAPLELLGGVQETLSPPGERLQRKQTVPEPPGSALAEGRLRLVGGLALAFQLRLERFAAQTPPRAANLWIRFGTIILPGLIGS